MVHISDRVFECHHAWIKNAARVGGKNDALNASPNFGASDTRTPRSCPRFVVASSHEQGHIGNVVYDDEDAGLEQETALVKAAPVALAWDRNGRRFPVPKNSRGWRVLRKSGVGRGRPTIVSTANGPLHIEIDASFEMLSEAVGHRPGWYVLYAVDENSVIISTCPPAHVEVVTEHGRMDGRQPQGDAVDRLCTTVQQLVMYSAQRDEAICSALGQMTAAISEIQRSAAELLRAASSGMDIAAGVAQPKQLTVPMPQLPPPPPPPKSFMDFLTSPAGNTAVSALGNVLTSLTNGEKK